MPSGSMDDDETKALLSGEVPQADLATSTHTRLHVPTRRLVVEPVLFFSCFLAIPLDSLIQQFVVHHYENADQGRSNATNATGGNRTLDECGHVVLSDISPQSLAAQFTTYMGIVNIVPCVLSTWFLVSSSDRLGRKTAIISPLIGLLLKGTIFALVIGTRSNIYWLTAAQLAYGISGGYITLLSACMAYIVDSTIPDKRLFRITVVELMSFLTLSVSLIGLGYLIEFLGYTIPCVISATGIGLVIAYTVFFVPETMRRDFNASICSLEYLYKPFTVFYQSKSKKIDWNLVLLLFAILPATFGGMGMNVQVLFLMHSPICWRSVSIGYFQAASLATITIGTMALVKLLKRYVSDNVIALLSGLSCICSAGYNAFCYTETMLYFVPALSVMAGGYIPAIRALMSKHVSQDLQGALFSGIGVVETFSMSVSQMAMSGLYAATQAWWAGFAYLVVSGCYVVATLIFGTYAITNRSRTH